MQAWAHLRVERRGRPWSGRRRTAQRVRRWCVCRRAKFDQVGLLRGLELGLLTTKATLGLGDLHALPRPHPDQVRLELSDHPEDVEQQPANRVVRVVQRAADVSLTPASVSSWTMLRASVSERASRPSLVTARVSPDRQAASALPAGRVGRGWCRSGRGRRRSGSASRRAPSVHHAAQSGLADRSSSGVPDEHSRHRRTVAVRPLSPCIISNGSSGNRDCRRSLAGYRRRS